LPDTTCFAVETTANSVAVFSFFSEGLQIQQYLKAQPSGFCWFFLGGGFIWFLGVS